MSRPITGRGTAESVWDGCELEALAPFERDAAHVVCVAAHPDDETLGAGGLLAVAERAGAEIEIVALTDGERGTGDGSPCDALGARRRAETIASLAVLLDRRPRIRYVGLADGHVDEALDEAAAAIAATARPGSLCLAPYRDDGHPDHEAAFAAASAACGAGGCRLAGYPIWLWHWATPADLGAVEDELRTVRLPTWALVRKRAAIDAFGSQLEGDGGAGILPPHVLARFHRPYEVFAI